MKLVSSEVFKPRVPVKSKLEKVLSLQNGYRVDIRLAPNINFDNIYEARLRTPYSHDANESFIGSWKFIGRPVPKNVSFFVDKEKGDKINFETLELEFRVKK